MRNDVAARRTNDRVAKRVDTTRYCVAYKAARGTGTVTSKNQDQVQTADIRTGFMRILRLLACITRALLILHPGR